MLQYGKARLSIMMFLQFFIWGAWYATGGNYMKTHGMTNAIYLAYTASSIGSVVSPFFLGAIADRFFPVQKVLGVMHILSGIFVFCAPFFAETVASPALFLLFLLLHMLCYMPTVSLATATAFHLLDNKEKEFPVIRVFGTLGWITAGIIISYLLKADTTALPMRISGVGGILMGLYSFTLPHIPPGGAGKKFSVRDIIGIDAFKKLGQSRSFIIFITGLLLISVPFASYFTYVPVYINAAGIADPAFKMTFGQMSEVVFLLVLPWFFLRFGVKWVMLAGMFAWTLRYALFAFAAPQSIEWMMIIGILLHGACYDFVYVASQVYIDKKADVSIRAQAQAMFVFISYGVGQGLGAITAGFIFNHIMKDNSSLMQWQLFWSVPLLFAAVVSLLFVFGFKEKTTVISRKTITE